MSTEQQLIDALQETIKSKNDLIKMLQTENEYLKASGLIINQPMIQPGTVPMAPFTHPYDLPLQPTAPTPPWYNPWGGPSSGETTGPTTPNVIIGDGTTSLSNGSVQLQGSTTHITVDGVTGTIKTDNTLGGTHATTCDTLFRVHTSGYIQPIGQPHVTSNKYNTVIHNPEINELADLDMKYAK